MRIGPLELIIILCFFAPLVALVVLAITLYTKGNQKREAERAAAMIRSETETKEAAHDLEEKKIAALEQEMLDIAH